MNGRILVVDDLEPNRRLLQVRLEAEYYDVEIATNGHEALAKAASAPPDLVLLDVMMPDMDGFEVCRRLKLDPLTAHVPVVMVTALDQREDRIMGLEAGADDFLSKPWDDAVLRARVRNLLRLKAITDELATRQETGETIAAMDAGEQERLQVGARILVVDDPCRASERLARRLEDDHHRPRLETDPQSALRSARGPWDLVIIDFAADTFDGQRFAERLKADEATRDLPLLAIIDNANRELVVRALEGGVNDVIDRPVDGQELAARVRTLVKRKRYADFLRARLDNDLEATATDQLTRAYTQRSALAQLRTVMEEASAARGALSVAVMDIDGLRHINNQEGHRVGDLVLRGVADRIQAAVGAQSIVGRMAGDEFVAVMPGLGTDDAREACKAARQAVAAAPFEFPGRAPINASISIGLAQFSPEDSLGGLLDRAGKGLAAAKERGANRVVTVRVKGEDQSDGPRGKRNAA